MKYIVILALVFIVFSCQSKQEQPQIIKEPATSKIVVGYVNHWTPNKWGDNFEKAKKLTHINYAFANIKDGEVVLGNAKDEEVFIELNKLKEVNPNLKILISVGGWTWSDHFSDAALTKHSREVFANSAIRFMLKHRLNGIDLDWEYPGQKGEDNVYRAVDKENFTFLLKRIREKLDSLSGGDQYLLTIATGANQAYLDHTNMAEAQKYLDFINIMTYDYFTGGSKIAGHHANLYKSDKSNGKGNYSDLAVQQHLAAGIPKNKLVLGVPFYGRYWKGVEPKDQGLYQAATGPTGGLSYAQIADSLKAEVFEEYWDESAKAPYIWRAKDSLWITYDNKESLSQKVQFVNENQLRGIMFWQFNGDNGELLQNIKF